MNISLTQKDFRTLVNGGIVEKDGVNIALQDIGYHIMLDEVSKAQETLNKPSKILEKVIKSQEKMIEDEEVTHGEFFGENIKRVQEFLKSKKFKKDK